MISFLLFKIRYHVHVGLQKITKNKRQNAYIMFFSGTIPNNLTDGFRLILDEKSLFRYILTSSGIVVRFSSSKKLKEISDILSKVYRNGVESFFIFDEKKNHVKILDQVHYKTLYDNKILVENTYTSLSKIDSFIKTLRQIEDSLMTMLNESDVNLNVDGLDVSENINVIDLDQILDKISKHGIASLTEEEKLILNRYSNND